MSPTLAGLKDLHVLQQQREEYEHQLKRGPQKIKARQKIADTRRAEVEAQKAALLELRKSADQKSLQLKSNEAKILELKAKLNAAASNREFDIFKEQIAADTMANSVLEDEILETLERVDTLMQELKELEAVLAAAEADVATCTDEVNSARPGLEASIAELKEQIAVAEKAVPTEHREVYRRLVIAHGAGALAELEGGACAACHTIVSAQDRVKLNVGKIVFCRSCGRLLYITQEAD